MMKATFTGGPDDRTSPEVTVFGMTFVRGEAADVSDLSPAQRAKLAGNPTFEVTDGDASKKARGKAAPAATPTPDQPVDIPPSWESLDDAALHELATKLDSTLDVDATRETAAETVKAELDRRATDAKAAG